MTNFLTRKMRATTIQRAWNFLFLGAPGVGKGTFSGAVSRKLGIPAVSTGDIIRAEIKSGSELGKKLKAIADAGQLVDDDIVTAMVRKRLAEPDAQKGYILVSTCVTKERECVLIPCLPFLTSSASAITCIICMTRVISVYL
jgi:hypothetical protein